MRNEEVPETGIVAGKGWKTRCLSSGRRLCSKQQASIQHSVTTAGRLTCSTGDGRADDDLSGQDRLFSISHMLQCLIWQTHNLTIT